MANGKIIGGFAPVIPNLNHLCLHVAGLVLRQETDDPTMRLMAPPAHKKFLDLHASRNGKAAVEEQLFLRLRNESKWESNTWGTAICRTEIWELWINEEGRYVFVAPRGRVPRRAIIDTGFSSGEVLVNSDLLEGDEIYPLQGLDNIILSNWLANYGDVILHASGILYEGEGYAFIGQAGAGKSTVVSCLAEHSGVTVLGEDQLVLRCIEGRFWIYGTPWHLNPGMCSPLGVQLTKLFFLDRSINHPTKACTPVDGVTQLMRTAFIPYYQPKGVAAILERLEYLANRVPFYTLRHELGSNVLKLIQDV
jgi:hypothetical protein